MKVALVHDYLKEYGGAERVLETLHEIFPQAPVFTTVYLPSFLGPHKDRLKRWDVRTSPLQVLPFKDKLISPIRLVAPLVFRMMNFNSYDVVIVSATGAYAPNMIYKGNAKHVCYYHTPPRYLYGYPTARDWQKYPMARALGEVANHFLRLVDFESAQRPDIVIANSYEVAGRIKKFYRREAVVIYPPVDLVGAKKALIKKHTERSYFVTGGRLARAKRVDLIIKAATQENLPLKVFGKEFAGYGDILRELAGPTVEFLGEITDQEKWDLMAGAKAFLFAAKHEDFGILPVEAMAVGTPVIALYSGGVKETVIDGKTGIFFKRQRIRDVLLALKKFEKAAIKSADCVAQAQKFSAERFKREIKECILKNA